MYLGITGSAVEPSHWPFGSAWAVDKEDYLVRSRLHNLSCVLVVFRGGGCDKLGSSNVSDDTDKKSQSDTSISIDCMP